MLNMLSDYSKKLKTCLVRSYYSSFVTCKTAINTEIINIVKRTIDFIIQSVSRRHMHCYATPSKGYSHGYGHL